MLGALVLTAGAVTPAAGAAPAAPPESAAAHGVRVAATAAARAGIDWGRCAAVEKLDKTVGCGTVRVPLDYTRPHGEQLSLTVSRARATGGEDDYQGPLLYNPGGPGGSGMRFPLYGARLGGTWKKLQRSYDLVGFAPRGVGRSAPVSCQDPEEFVAGPNRSPRRPTETFKAKMRLRAEAYARGCARDQGDRLGHFTTADNARDLDVLRAALGRKKINYLGVSYGTYIGSVYATLFPGHVRRLVLDSVVDPGRDKIWYRANLDQNAAFQRRWQDWKAWTARHDDVYGLGDTPQAVQAAFDEVRDAVDRRAAGRYDARNGEDRDGRGSRKVRGPRDDVGSRELLAGYLSVGYADSAWAPAASALAEYREGNRGPLLAAAAPDLSGATAAENGNAVYNAVECSDAPWPREWYVWNRDNTLSDLRAPFTTWDNAWLNLPCAFWRGPRSQPVEVGTAPGALPHVLLLAATRDGATPYEGALEAQRRLRGSSLVTERGAGTHGLSGGANDCVNAHLEAYLLDGKAPGRRAECAARPEPKPVYSEKAEAKRADGGSSLGAVQARPATSSVTGFRRPV